MYEAAGATVLVGDVNQELGQAVVEQIEREGGTASFCRVDVSIVNIGSVSAHRPQPANAAYGPAKHGVLRPDQGRLARECSPGDPRQHGLSGGH